MSQKLPLRLVGIVKQGAHDFFTTNGITDFKADVSEHKSTEFQWTGIIGLSGDLLTGSLAVTCQESL